MTLSKLIITLILVAGIVGHWVIKLPGPVTKRERTTAKHCVSRWLFNLTIPITFCLALYGACDLFDVCSWPCTLDLVSRARPANEPVRDLFPVGYNYGRLEPIVDEALDAATKAGAQGWAEGSPQQRLSLRTAILPTLNKSDWPWHHEQSENLDRAALPQWVTESVEISVAQVALRRFNVKQLRIAAAPPAMPLGGWTFASSVLGDSVHPVVTVDDLSNGRQGLFIQRLFSAVVSNGAMTVQAVIDGAFSPSDASAKILKILLVTGGPNARSSDTCYEERSFDVSVPLDALKRRVVVADIAIQNLPYFSQAWVTDEVRHCSVKVVDLRLPKILPHLDVDMPGQDASNAAWHATFDAVADMPEFRSFRADLNSIGLNIPSVGTPAADQTVRAYLWDHGGWLIIARNASAAAIASSHIHAMKYAPQAIFAEDPFGQRAGPDSAGHNEMSSWVQQPVIPVRLDSGWQSLEVTDDSRLVLQPIVRVDEPSDNVALSIGHRLGNPRPFIWTGKYDDEPIVLIGVDPVGAGELVLKIAQPPDSETKVGSHYDPVTVMALVRTISWATKYVNEQFPLEQAHPSQAVGPEPDSGPLLTAEDLDQVTTTLLATRTKFDTLFIGVYTLFVVANLWRTLIR